MLTLIAVTVILFLIAALASAEKSPPRKALLPPCEVQCLEAKNAALQKLAVKRLKGWDRANRRVGTLRVALKKSLADHGWPHVDSCLNELIQRESHWNVHATNPSTGAYGLPQALPGSKMASAGADWRDNPNTQIRWMLGYVSKYGGSCGALAFQKSHGWY